MTSSSSTSLAPKLHSTNFTIEAIIGKQEQSSASNGQEVAVSVIQKPMTTTSTTRSQTTVAARKVRPKNFLCPACKMAFSNNGQLKNHARIHTGERPFTCQYQGCNKTFTRNEELTRHKLIHSGFRPHVCNTCNKRFGRKDHLKKHLKTHENKRFRQLRKQRFISPQQIPTSDHHSIGFYHHHPTTTTTTTTAAAAAAAAAAATTTNPINALSTSHHHDIRSPDGLRPTPPLVKHSIQSIERLMPNSPLNFPPAFNQTLTSNTTMPTSNADSLVLHQAAYLAGAQMASSVNQDPLLSPSMQHLASEYWSRWYNLMGLYGQYNHHYQ